MTLLELPVDPLFQIFTFLDVRSRSALTQASPLLWKICDDFWRLCYVQEISKHRNTNPELSFRAQYILSGTKAIVGGFDGKRHTGFVYSVKNSSLTTLAPKHHLNIPRCNHSVAAAKEFALTSGGASLSYLSPHSQNSLTPLGSVELLRFDDEDDGRWRHVQSLTQPRFAHASSAVKEKVYVMGGTTSFSGAKNSFFPSLSNVLSTVEVYIAERNQWHMGPSLRAPRFHSASASSGQNVYVLGGNISNPTTRHSDSTLDMLDTRTSDWIQSKCMNFDQRTDFSLITLDNMLYAIGGSNPDIGHVPSIQRLDLRRPDQWQTIAVLSVPRSGFAAWGFMNKIHIVGGMSCGIKSKAVEVLDIVSNKLSRCPDLDSPFIHASAVLMQRSF